MKKYIATIALGIFANLSFAQMTIGDVTKASANQSSVLLDFEKNAGRGLLLPTISDLSKVTSTVNGTFILDATNATAARIKLREKGVWRDLSLTDGNATATKLPATSVDNVTAKAVLGTDDATAPDGVLVLNSTTKAMVLPIVDNTDKIINPAPGMMVYVKNTTIDKSTLAVFNGTSWAFWAAN